VIFVKMASRVLFALLWATCITAYYDIDDSVLYKIDFPGPKKVLQVVTEDSSFAGTGTESGGGVSTVGVAGLPDLEEDLASVVVTSVDNEQYTCSLPQVDSDDGSKSDDYQGLSVLGLLETMFTQQTCAYRLESYWTYELCHGKHLRQYHEEREGKTIKVQEYFLGKFNKEAYDFLVSEYEKDVANGITRHPPTKKIDGLNLPYHEILMKDGTVCDLNGQPRQTKVLYVCYPAGKNQIYSFKEVSTCEYEVVVLTSVLCSHPSYKPEESTEHSVTCRPVAEGQARKPAKLTGIEVDSLKLRTEKMLEAHMSGGDKPGQVKIEIRPVEVDIEGIDGAEDLIKEGQWKETKREPFKPLMDPQVVKQFLKGEYCLYGGSGWWKYEFCYGKKVDQYHEEGNGQKTVINLGRFKEEDHLAWLQSHPSKKPKEGSSRKQVSIFYSGGEVCDLTGKPRQVEVKLKCKPADSPSTVSLYLLEPKTCQYMLGVESPLVCDLLPHADPNTGLFPVGLVDTIGHHNNEEEQKVKEIDTADAEDFKTTSNKVTQESVHIADGVKTSTRKVIVNGMVVSTETVREKDGVKIEHSEVVKDFIEVDDKMPDVEEYIKEVAFDEDDEPNGDEDEPNDDENFEHDEL